MKVVNWNIERHAPQSWQASSLIAEIDSHSPDLICLTEAWKQSLDSLEGHCISAPGVAWSPQDADERKVVLWSPNQWKNPQIIEVLERTGSAVTGITTLGNRDIRVVGVCIPYHFANPVGQSPKAKMWEQHETYLKSLKPLLDSWSSEGPVMVLGDFNRRIPRKWGPKRSYELLEEALENFEVVTTGELSGVSAHTIDHVAISGINMRFEVTGLCSENHEGKTRSDHFGVLVQGEFI